jgi:predicted DNA binding CopG/RHH family protein
MKKLKQIPEFKNEDEEREFWAVNDSAEYLDWGISFRSLFPELRPTSQTISIRLPRLVLEKLKMLAKKRDVPYQSLIKVFLNERINEELIHHDE